ncbi:MAG: hypothetical protein ACRD4K_07010, partial [Candidatus Acidiferrales bacterium]
TRATIRRTPPATPARRDARRNSSRESGYALMLVAFMAALMIIAAVTVELSWLTEGKRDKEAEMIWRGEQYKRGVRLYYHKLGKFPQSMDDLVKGNGSLHFMRKAYKDPTASDGNWRMIYVTPAGQLVGSVRYVSLQQMAAAEQMAGAGPPPDSSQQPGTPAEAAFGQPGQQQGAPGGPGAAPLGGTLSPGGQQDPNSGAANPGQQPNTGIGGQPGQSPFGPGNAPLGGGTFGQSQFSLSSGSTGGGQTFGGSIIGVGGSSDKKSIMFYKGGKTYHRWEFIWNPLSDVIGQVNQAGQVPQGAQGLPGSQGLQSPQSPMGGGGIVPLPTGTPQNPGSTPPPQ